MKGKSFRRTLAALLATATVMNSSIAGSLFNVSAEEMIYEFEDGVLSGATVQEKGTERYSEGASGDKFVFLENGGDTATVTVDVKETGMYKLVINISAPYGDKVQNFSVNGVDQGQFSCEKNAAGEWSELTLGTVRLEAGKNEITIVSSWGWMDIDYLKVIDGSSSTISASQTMPCDYYAISEAYSLMDYLSSVYGEHIISGQQEIYSGGAHGLEYEFEYLNDTTGHYPAIRGFDYGNFCCPCYGSDDGSTDRIIDWVKNRNGIATASFHLNVPTDFASYTIGSKIDWSQTTYTEKTDFSPSKAATEGTKENEYLMQSLTILAKQFNDLEALGIPVIWRPYHEAEGSGGEKGSWFWWGREGSEAYKKLWLYTYDVLTNKFDCHNLIWEWNSYNYSSSTKWYPGDDYVDIIGYDKYSCTDWSTGSPVITHNDSPVTSTFYGILEKYNGAKMISMAENDCFSTPSKLIEEKAGWLYFLTWYDGGSADNNFLTNPDFNTKEDTIAMYQSEYCITLDELPTDLYSRDVEIPGEIPTKPTQPPTEPPTPGVTTEADPNKLYADVTEETGYIAIDFPRAVGDTAYLNVSLGDDITYANGCLGASVTIDGKYYWVQAQWEAAKSGEVKVDMNKIFGVTLGTEPVEDEAIIAEAIEKFKEQKSFQGQVWWAQDSAENEADTSLVKIIDAYLKESDNEVVNGVFGDADGDAEVTINDVVIVICNVASPNKNPISSIASDLCDVYQRGDGINVNDVTSIQKYLAGIITELPESFM